MSWYHWDTFTLEFRITYLNYVLFNKYCNDMKSHCSCSLFQFPMQIHIQDASGQNEIIFKPRAVPPIDRN